MKISLIFSHSIYKTTYAQWSLFLQKISASLLSQYIDHLFRYGHFHNKDKMVMRQSYIYNGNPYTDKIAFYIEMTPMAFGFVLIWSVNECRQQVRDAKGNKLQQLGHLTDNSWSSNTRLGQCIYGMYHVWPISEHFIAWVTWRQVTGMLSLAEHWHCRRVLSNHVCAHSVISIWHMICLQQHARACSEQSRSITVLLINHVIQVPQCLSVFVNHEIHTCSLKQMHLKMIDMLITKHIISIYRQD